jgi:hypothetical protein
MPHGLCIKLISHDIVMTQSGDMFLGMPRLRKMLKL